MTAAGFLLFLLALLVVNGNPWDERWHQRLFAVVGFIGAALMALGVAKWLWEVMP